MNILIGFSRPIGFFKPYAWIIMLWERTLFSHVYVKFRPPGAKNWVVFQASGSFVNLYSERQFLKIARVVKEFEFNIGPSAYESFLIWVYSVLGTVYGLKTVLGIPFQTVFNLKRNPFSDGRKSWFCSELVANALDNFLGVHIKRVELETAGPRKIYEFCETLSREKLCQKTQ